MLFFSPYAAFRVGIRPESIFYHPATGVETHRVKALRAEFGRLGNEYPVKDPVSGEMTVHAEILGNYFDTDAASEGEGWDADEKESVENRLLMLCKRRPDQIRHIEVKAPTITSPWPTYDRGDAKEVVLLAESLGLVAESIAYERTKDARPDVLNALELLLDRDAPEGPLRNAQEPEREILTPARGGESKILVV